MKKVFSVFMIFFAVFLVSCGGLLDEDSTNTVRITMPGNARSASAGGSGDVDYYNIQIASQSFSNVSPGTTVESMQLPVGMSISISVEAIGKIKDNGQDVGSGRRVAYYQTTQTLPAEGLTLGLNMANYKTEYHKVTLNANQFGGRNNEVVYVAGGSSYTLPNYGTYTPPQGSAQMHISWRYTADPTNPDNVTIYKPGETVAITRDMEFELDYEELATITFYAEALGGNDMSGSISGWAGSKAYVRKNTRYTPPTYTSFTYNGLPYTPLGWEYYGNGTDVNFGESVEITTDARFHLKTKGLLLLTVEGATINLNDTIIERGGQYYIWTWEPFTLPTGKKDDDDSPVTEWNAGFGAWFKAPDESLPYAGNDSGAGWSSEASFGEFVIRPNN